MSLLVEVDVGNNGNSSSVNRGMYGFSPYVYGGYMPYYYYQHVNVPVLVISEVGEQPNNVGTNREEAMNVSEIVLSRLLQYIGNLYRSALIALITAPDLETMVRDVEIFRQRSLQLLQEASQYLNPLAIDAVRSYIEELAQSLETYVKTRSIDQLITKIEQVAQNYEIFYNMMGQAPTHIIKLLAEQLGQ